MLWSMLLAQFSMTVWGCGGGLQEGSLLMGRRPCLFANQVLMNTGQKMGPLGPPRRAGVRWYSDPPLSLN